MSTENQNDLNMSQSTFILEFYRLRCAGIPKLVADGDYDAETANQEIDLIIDSVGRLTTAKDELRTKIIEKAMGAKAAIAMLDRVCGPRTGAQ